ncbi:bifunctional 3-(3-hydroxy-phenyl)propionate/3-hydroxycinnamic acid hydroxylase [Roseomonas sp. NAR14]|uniref:Bifunctional 3-(3-hydroxy-phenyl)propionate/3-hydroxycinnamic acid hydroxylase n=1 Tax=Roseomonas acroporae TaxID=2937791 RepID=A0A9X2BWD3_9PROT|nr:bifunctional 3-(3-hydroxy-phenyl)propionate/3-hydroxycinnamic acid hydroxylase [Roseomonas acroporae]MCK8787678.1 bifunctional 3-(3-hydroxy-phenyl)propionate/3-hydroxycinnamic acid hydroxylase [Roseomonas acroporae]
MATEGPAMPAAADGAAAMEFDVAVIGYGPVGAALANLLGAQGVRTLVIEREAAAYHLPRAVHFDDEVMRIFQSMGLAEAILPITHVSPGTHFVDGAGRLLLDWSRPMAVGPQGWNVSYRFHQPELEDVLRRGVARWPSVTLRARTEVFALEPGADGVGLRFEELSNGRIGRATARYVVGCDGARSLVRRWIGEPMDDLGFHERWLVVDALLRRPRPDLGDHTVQHCDPARPATYVRGTGNRRRWEIALREGDDLAALARPEGAWPLLARWITPEDAVLERAAIYTFHSTVARRWREGRLLLAGDAAHQTPPFLGQGMCAGIRDAANLAWKLVRVLRGEAPESLLDSYGSERAPHVEGYIREAVRIGGLINTTAMEAVVSGDVLRGGAAERLVAVRPALGPGPAAGWTAHAGRLPPQPRLGNGALLDDHVGPRFAAVMRPEFAAGLPHALLDRLAARGAVLVADAAPGVTAMLDDLGAQAVLLRPDRHVLGAARDLDEMRALAAAL